MNRPGDGAEDEVPEGSYAAGRRVRLPQGAERPVTVYLNGVPQVEGSDYRIERGSILFTREIIKEKPVGVIRWTIMLIGLWGTYRRHETVDVEYGASGRRVLASDLPVEP